MIHYLTLPSLPLRVPNFFILLSLSPGPKHGYAILKEVEALSEGWVLLSTGTLYGAIKRLLDRGRIRRVADSLPSGADCERKVDILTEIGRGVLKAELEKLKKLVAIAQIHTAEGTS